MERNFAWHVEQQSLGHFLFRDDLIVELFRFQVQKTDFEPLSEELIKYFSAVRRMLACYLPRDCYRRGDEDQLDLIREATLHAMEPLEWLFKSYFRYEVKGLEHVPQSGRAIVVSNHGLLPLDGWFLFYEIMRATGRWVRGLTDWRIYRFPMLRQFFMDMGMVVGRPENGDALLRREELIFIMPGGSKEAWKSSKYRYRLLCRSSPAAVSAAGTRLIHSGGSRGDNGSWYLTSPACYGDSPATLRPRRC